MSGGFVPRPDVPQETVDRLRDLYVQARRVNGATPEDHPDRVASVEFTATLAGLVERGVTMYRLAQVLGVKPSSVYARLARHGYRRASPSMRGVVYLGRQTEGTVVECKRAHPMAPGHPNVRVNPGTGRRSCKECDRRRHREWRARKASAGGTPTPR